jgi:Opioid growth factor receptor (OGFr) conserved region
MSSIIDFYRGTAPDYMGRRLSDIWAWDDERLEWIHNYIQVLFPLGEASFFNIRAPLVNDDTIAAFLAEERLRANLARSFERMLSFYGLRFDPKTGKVEMAVDFAEKALNWLNPYNHNYRRITRILRSLTSLGLPERGRAFFDCLAMIYAARREEIGPVAFAYWQEAVGLRPPTSLTQLPDDE